MGVVGDIGGFLGFGSGAGKPAKPPKVAKPDTESYLYEGNVNGAARRSDSLDAYAKQMYGRSAPTTSAAQATSQDAYNSQLASATSALQGQAITAGGVKANMLGTAQNAQGQGYLDTATGTFRNALGTAGDAAGYRATAANAIGGMNPYLLQGQDVIGASGQTLAQAAGQAGFGNQLLYGAQENVNTSTGLLNAGMQQADVVNAQLGGVNAQLGLSNQQLLGSGQYATQGMSDVEAARAAAGGQQQFINNLDAAAFGNGGPSAAELAMQAQADRSAAQNLAMAQSVGGPGGNAARIAAVNANAGNQAQLVRDLGVQRAQEQLAQRQLLGQSLAQMRGQSLDTAGAVGNLGQLGLQAGGALGQNAAIANQAANTALGVGGLYGNIAGQATTNAQALTQAANANSAQMQALSGVAGQQTANAGMLGTYGGLQLQQGQAFGGLGAQTIDQAALQAQIGAQQGQLAGLNTGIAANYYTGANSLAGLAGAQNLTTGAFGELAGQQQQGAQFNAGLQQEAGLANQNAALQQQALNDAAFQNLFSQGTALGQWQTEQKAQAERDRINAQLGVGTIGASTYGSYQQGQAQRLGATMSGGGTAIAALLPLLSDIRSKEDVRPMLSDEKSKEEIRRLRAENTMYALSEAERQTKQALSKKTSYPGPYEDQFQKWYAGVADKLNLDPNPDDAEHYYDYRRFYDDVRAGKEKAPTEGGHFTSQYKMPGHPREYLRDEQGKLFNTVTGEYPPAGYVVSDAHSKERIRQLEEENKALRGPVGSKQWEANFQASLDADIAREEAARRQFNQGFQSSLDQDIANYQRLASPQGSREGLAPINAYSYSYKPEVARRIGEDTAPRAGVMAQDLQKSPYFRDSVVSTPEGLAIDQKRALSSTMAATAGIDKRVKALEASPPAMASDIRNKDDIQRLDKIEEDARRGLSRPTVYPIVKQPGSPFGSSTQQANPYTPRSGVTLTESQFDPTLPSSGVQLQESDFYGAPSPAAQEKADKWKKAGAAISDISSNFGNSLMRGGGGATPLPNVHYLPVMAPSYGRYG